MMIYYCINPSSSSIITSFENMASIHTATYIKKLVKMVYQKEKQIEVLKKDLRQFHISSSYKENEPQDQRDHIDQKIKNQVFLATTQLREVNLQIAAMQQKIVELELGLDEETVKNNIFSEEIATLKTENSYLKEEAQLYLNENERIKQENSSLLEIFQKSRIETSKLQQQFEELEEIYESLKESEELLRSEKNQLIVQIGQIRQRQQNNSIKLIQKQKNISQLKEQISQQRYLNQEQTRQIQRLRKDIQSQDNQTITYLNQNSQLKGNIQDLLKKVNKYQFDLKQQKGQYDMKLRENSHLNQTLKDYEEFAFEISKYIESAYIKHCCQGMLRSSKKILKQTEKVQNLFEGSFRKITIIQNWMDETSQKLERIIQQQEIPNATLENLSIIVKSFEQKLDICDLTQKLDKQRQQMIRNQQELINNLQKECENSYQHQRSKIIELTQIKQVLKMTKEVNRQLMDQINQKQYIISQCRKAYEKVNTKSYPQIAGLIKILNRGY